MSKNNWWKPLEKKAGPFFMHTGKIPVDFAKAVYNVMHNQAGTTDWSLIDTYNLNKKPIFEWIRSIMESNGVENIEQEMQWWISEINGNVGKTAQTMPQSRNYKFVAIETTQESNRYILEVYASSPEEALRKAEWEAEDGGFEERGLRKLPSEDGDYHKSTRVEPIQ